MKIEILEAKQFRKISPRFQHLSSSAQDYIRNQLLVPPLGVFSYFTYRLQNPQPPSEHLI